jgi:peptidyl-tRNA hydrolase
MCHTFKTDKTTFIFNSDFSGKMRIKNKETNQKIVISAEDLKELVKAYKEEFEGED